MKQLKKTKIITTLWPSTDSEEKIEQLYIAWANIIRMNYSHSNYDYFWSIIDKVKNLNNQLRTNLGILTDTKWPEIRTKDIPEKIRLEKNEIFILTTLNNENKTENDIEKKIVCDYEPIIEDLEVWKIVDIDTWLLKAEIIEKDTHFLLCKALNKHDIWSKRHLNLPWTKIKLPWITDSDKKDIEFAVNKWTDFIALSFVRNKENILELKSFLKKINAPSNIQIISKIESDEALKNLNEIIEYSDWIMIARWDLWAEIPFESLPIVQRDIATKCKDNWKYFIVATQILETMIENPIPTRAEVTDIFNAVMQKADCVMLSWETAAWKYPIETVSTMKKVLKYSETQVKYKHNYFTRDLKENEKKKTINKKFYLYCRKHMSKSNDIFHEIMIYGKNSFSFQTKSSNIHFYFFW